MEEPTPTVVAVKASAGGVEALRTLAGGLPENLDAAVPSSPASSRAGWLSTGRRVSSLEPARVVLVTAERAG